MPMVASNEIKEEQQQRIISPNRMSIASSMLQLHKPCILQNIYKLNDVVDLNLILQLLMNNNNPNDQFKHLNQKNSLQDTLEIKNTLLHFQIINEKLEWKGINVLIIKQKLTEILKTKLNFNQKSNMHKVISNVYLSKPILDQNKVIVLLLQNLKIITITNNNKIRLNYIDTENNNTNNNNNITRQNNKNTDPDAVRIKLKNLSNAMTTTSSSILNAKRKQSIDENIAPKLLKKIKVEPKINKFTNQQSGAYFHHPLPTPNKQIGEHHASASLTNTLKTKDEIDSELKSFKNLPSPEEMLLYQTRCLTEFIQRYNNYYNHCVKKFN